MSEIGYLRTEMKYRAMSQHYWIIEVNGNPKNWAWREYPTARGGLDMRAYRTKEEAGPDLYQARRLYGHARLTKFVAEARDEQRD